jgi:hypothetical protein
MAAKQQTPKVKKAGAAKAPKRPAKAGAKKAAPKADGGGTA